MGEDVSQLALSDRHGGTRFEGSPQTLLGSTCVVSWHVVVVPVEAPGRRGVSPTPVSRDRRADDVDHRSFDRAGGKRTDQKQQDWELIPESIERDSF